jgi:ATP-dependent DNA helicase RecQ
LHSPQQILHQYWGYTQFRGEQENIITGVLQQKNILALLPTGSGKSICFQLPTLLQKGCCLVVSPLVALMKDQVQNLTQKGIAAIAITAELTYKEINLLLQQACNGAYKFIYVSPERLQSNLFKTYLNRLPICLIAVDEAHCISQWGYDFRPSYLQINEAIKQVPNVPVIALTASATLQVQQDILQQLQLKDTAIFKQSFERKNISYSVFYIEDKLGKLLSVLQNVDGSSLVYCKSRKWAHRLANQLHNLGLKADYYHAGLTSDERQYKQQNWVNNKIRIMVCTNAFGMGIDKPDVRTVIHFHLPECLENYYQEAGRAGRDGKKSYAVLLYNSSDEREFLDLINQKFPSVETLKHIYQQIANYLSLPIGSGEGLSYDFDLGHFAKTFKLDILVVANALKAIEQEGHFSFNETVFISSKIKFIADKFFLEQIEKSSPNQDAVLKCLLRTYEGIYDEETNISEKLIAKLLSTKLETVVEILKELNAKRIIGYKPQKNTPQLYFNYNRAPANHIAFNNEKYLWRKEQYAKRLQSFYSYIHESNICRSQQIARYFGDFAIPTCGLCDVCLQKKQTQLSANELLSIKEKIFGILKEKIVDIAFLLDYLKPMPKYKIWEALKFLQDEKQVFIDKHGNIKKI